MVANFGDLRSSVSEGGWKVTVDVRSVSLSGRDATDGNLLFLGCFLFVFRTGPSFRSQDRARRGEADHAAIALGNRIAR